MTKSTHSVSVFVRALLGGIGNGAIYHVDSVRLCAIFSFRHLLGQVACTKRQAAFLQRVRTTHVIGSLGLSKCAVVDGDPMAIPAKLRCALTAHKKWGG